LKKLHSYLALEPGPANIDIYRAKTTHSNAYMVHTIKPNSSDSTVED